MIGLIASVGAFIMADRWEHQRIESAFLVAAKNRVAAVRRQFEANVQAVQSIVAFYAASQLVERKEFHEFAAVVKESHAAVSALLWALHLRGDQRQAFEQGMLTHENRTIPIRDLGPDGTLINAAQSPRYVAICYEELDASQSLLGFNLLSEPVRREAIDAASTRGTMTLSDPVTLLHATDRPRGLLLIHPIHGDRSDENSPVRDNRPVGFIIGEVDLAVCLHEAMTYLAPEEIETSLEVGSGLMPMATTPSEVDPVAGTARVEYPRFFEQIQVAGQSFLVTCRARPAFAASRRTWEAVTVLIVGMVVTILLTRYLVMSTRRTSRYEALAHERGTELDLREKKLKEVHAALQVSEAELSLARRVQTSLLPAAPPKLEGIELAALSLPAYRVSGDHYDFFPVSPSQLGIVVGDASGHGLAAAMLMVELHTCLRAVSRDHKPLDQIVQAVNRVLTERMLEDRFITLLLAALDPTRRALIYANAGHPPGLVIASDGKVKHLLESASMPIGIDPDIAFPSSEAMHLTKGDILFLMTDGVFDAMSPKGELFGMDRAVEIVAAGRADSPQSIIERLRKSIHEFCEGNQPHDDVTMVVLKVQEELRVVTAA